MIVSLNYYNINDIKHDTDHHDSITIINFAQLIARLRSIIY